MGLNLFSLVMLVSVSAVPYFNLLYGTNLLRSSQFLLLHFPKRPSRDMVFWQKAQFAARRIHVRSCTAFLLAWWNGLSWLRKNRSDLVAVSRRSFYKVTRRAFWQRGNAPLFPENTVPNRSFCHVMIETYSKPHALMTSKASGRKLFVVQR